MKDENSNFTPIWGTWYVPGSADVVLALLNAGADTEAPSVTGTPLLWAAGSGNLAAIKTLLQVGANCNAVSPDGCTAILMAAARGESSALS